MALIGLAGRIGSGKDTVGNIIQELTAKRGKFNLVTEYTWEIRKFAGKLKEIASILTGIPRERFEDQEFKKSYLGPEWNYWAWVEDGEKHATMEDATRMVADYQGTPFDQVDTTRLRQYRMTVRQFLQQLGTDGVRDGVHPQAWINAAFSDYKEEEYTIPGVMSFMPFTRYPNWIFTDMRFPNEMEAIKKRGGLTLLIARELEPVDYPTLESRHPSETALDGQAFDWVLDNNGSLSDLERNVKEILSHYKLLPV